MFNETYDEYIRSILGYTSNNSYNNYQNYNNQNLNSINLDLEKSYPEIYKIVYPMIRTKCDNNRSNITNEEIENMTDEIYYALEVDDKIQLNRSSSSISNTTKNTEKKTEIKSSEKLAEKRETRQINRNLRDLIKILLIRELISGRPGPGPRPPFWDRPGGPGPGPRPPIRPPFGPGGPLFNREFENNSYDIFEY